MMDSLIDAGDNSQSPRGPPTPWSVPVDDAATYLL